MFTGPQAHVLHGGKSLHCAHQPCFAWTSREADVELSRPGNFVQLTIRCFACNCWQMNKRLGCHVVINAKWSCVD